jgi:hypothetical protein
MAYLMRMSVAQTINLKMVGGLVNNELERTWKEMAVA